MFRDALDRTREYVYAPFRKARGFWRTSTVTIRSSRWWNRLRNLGVAARGYVQRGARWLGGSGAVAATTAALTTKWGQDRLAHTGKALVTGVIGVTGQVFGRLSWLLAKVPGPGRWLAARIDHGYARMARAGFRMLNSERWASWGLVLRTGAGWTLLGRLSRVYLGLKVTRLTPSNLLVRIPVSYAVSYLFATETERKRLQDGWSELKEDISRTEKTVLGDGVTAPGKPTIISVSVEVADRHHGHIVELVTKQHEKPGSYNNWDQVSNSLRGQVAADFKALMPGPNGRATQQANKAAGAFATEITALVKAARDNGDADSPFSKIGTPECNAAIRAIAEAQVEKFGLQRTS